MTNTELLVQAYKDCGEDFERVLRAYEKQEGRLIGHARNVAWIFFLAGRVNGEGYVVAQYEAAR